MSYVVICSRDYLYDGAHPRSSEVFSVGTGHVKVCCGAFSNPPGKEEELSLLADKLSSRWEEIPGMVVGVTEWRPDTLSIRPSLTAPLDQSSREIEGHSANNRGDNGRLISWLRCRKRHSPPTQGQGGKKDTLLYIRDCSDELDHHRHFYTAY